MGCSHKTSTRKPAWPLHSGYLPSWGLLRLPSALPVLFFLVCLVLLSQYCLGGWALSTLLWWCCDLLISSAVCPSILWIHHRCVSILLLRLWGGFWFRVIMNEAAMNIQVQDLGGTPVPFVLYVLRGGIARKCVFGRYRPKIFQRGCNQEHRYPQWDHIPSTISPAVRAACRFRSPAGSGWPLIPFPGD